MYVITDLYLVHLSISLCSRASNEREIQVGTY